jgi:hypothetical protein
MRLHTLLIIELLCQYRPVQVSRYKRLFHFMVMNNISYIKNERGKHKLILKRYIYILEKQGLN